MQIEIIGCTSAGKSTLARRMVQAGHELGIDVQLSDDFVLKLIRLNRIKNAFVRRRVIEALALLTCLVLWRKHRKFYDFAIRASLQAPGSWLYKANVARIALRKIGIYEIIRRYGSDQQIILLDNEGVLQAAHTLFVHGDAQPVNGLQESKSSPHGAEELSTFVGLAPLPDAVLYLRQPEAILIERTLKRGHHRLPDRSYAKVERFVRSAEEAFEVLQRQPKLGNRLVVINGEWKTVVTRAYNDNRLLMVNKLVLAGLNGAAAEHAFEIKSNGKSQTDPTALPASRLVADAVAPGGASAGQGIKMDSGLTIRLIESLNRSGVEYCHWKSNFYLAQTLSGELDIDLLVGHRSLPEVFTILAALGFKAAIVDSQPSTPGIFHYYGLDPCSGKLIHVHLFSIVLTGESFVKSHFLPFEMMLLENRSNIGPMRVPSKSAELVLFVLRMFIKYGALMDVLRLFKKSDSIRKEVKWLLSESNLAEALNLLKKYCSVVEESLFLKCLDALKGDSALIKRTWLAYTVRRRLRVYAKYTLIKSIWAYAQFIWSKMHRWFSGNRKNKKLQAGGAIIAFVGADATGKSTLVAETGRWLGKVFAVRTVHVGKPPSSSLTVPIKIFFPLARLLLPQRRHSKVAVQKSPDSSPPKTERLSGILHAIRAVALAWDRRRLVMKVRRAAARGEIIICDRYPTETTGAMDSPRLWEQPDKKGLPCQSPGQARGWQAAFYNRLARFEQRLYREMPPPDIVLRLKVSLKTAMLRNRTRSKTGNDSDEYLEIRHQQSQEWYRPGTKHIYDIDTEQSIAETVLSVKKAIWEAL
jgi:thymidylate kinase